MIAEDVSIKRIDEYRCHVLTGSSDQLSDGTVVRALASHQCGLIEFVVGSLLCSERFFSGYSGFPLKNQHFQISSRYRRYLLRWLEAKVATGNT